MKRQNAELKRFLELKPVLGALASRQSETELVFNTDAAFILKKSWISVATCSFLTLNAVILWIISLPHITVNNITDYGLISAFPITFFLAFGLLIISFCLSLNSNQTSSGLFFLNVIILIFFVHSTVPLVYDEPRYAWTYKHIGVVDYIQQHGTVDPKIDIYHNWPGFFALGAIFTNLLGVKGTVNFAAWSQVFFNLLYLGPLLLIFKSCTTDRRLVWLSIWFFYLTNWIGQDYFAPQALAYFFHLVFLAICLTWFRVKQPSNIWILVKLIPLPAKLKNIILKRKVDPRPPEIIKPYQQMFLKLIIIISFSYIVSSHQLTPVMTIVTVIALLVTGSIKQWNLLTLMLVIFVSWLIYVAITYVSGNILIIYASMGRLFDNVNTSLSNISVATPGHAFVAQVTRMFTASVWLLALVGGFRRFKSRFLDLSIAIIAVAPFPVMFAQSYGGEMLFRIYLFSLPGVVFFAAAAFFPRGKSVKPWLMVIITILASSGLLFGFLFAYYGQEQVNYISKAEIEAEQILYKEAPPGSLIVTTTYDYPLRFQSGYEKYNYRFLSDFSEFKRRQFGVTDLDSVFNLMQSKNYPASYILLTRSQKMFVELNGLQPAGLLSSLEKELLNSNQFKEIYNSDDAKVYRLVKSAPDVNGENK